MNQSILSWWCRINWGECCEKQGHLKDLLTTCLLHTIFSRLALIGELSSTGAWINWYSYLLCTFYTEDLQLEKVCASCLFRIKPSYASQELWIVQIVGQCLIQSTVTNSWSLMPNNSSKSRQAILALWLDLYSLWAYIVLMSAAV